jgi:hypothetical protein
MKYKKTEPIKGVIPRELDPGIAELLDSFSKGIEESVNFGSHILNWDAKITRGGDENFPPALLFRHFLELMDSISILIRQSSIDPCKLILRGALEVYFSLEYIFEKDTENRTMAFLVWHNHKNIKRYKSFDPNEEQGKQMQSSLNKDKLVNGINLKNNPEIQLAISKLEGVLKTPKYQNGEAEYQRLRNEGEKNPPWYRLFNGPRNIEDLANYLKLSGLYEMFYRYWSGPTHGTDVIQGKATDNPMGGTNIIQIRYAKDAQAVTSQSMIILLKVFKVYINHRIPEKEIDFNSWYISSIREFFHKVCSKEQLIKFS